MRITFDALNVLDAIDRGGSFAAAAEELHRVPSAITYTVQKLEQEMGVKLFDRSGHRATLTAAGHELLREGRNLLRAADEVEARVKRVATGWESEFRLAYDDVVPIGTIFPLVEEFYREECGTRLRLLSEIYGGSWDALASGRADLVIAAPGEGPSGGGYSTRPLGTIHFAFAVAPHHPLANAPEPLKSSDIFKYRAVSAADSSRNLPARTSGILAGQDVFTVHNMHTKVTAQKLGLGVGYLPLHMIQKEIADGSLVVKATIEGKPSLQLFIAWRSSHMGKAMQWFLSRLGDGSALRDEIGLTP